MSDDKLAVPIVGVTVSEGKTSRCGCFIQYEVTFSASSPDALWAIAFENYYVATICIEQGFPIKHDGNYRCNCGRSPKCELQHFFLIFLMIEICCIYNSVSRQMVKQVFDTPKSSLITI